MYSLIADYSPVILDFWQELVVVTRNGPRVKDSKVKRCKNVI